MMTVSIARLGLNAKMLLGVTPARAFGMGGPGRTQGAKSRSRLRIVGERKKMQVPPGLGGKQSLVNGPMQVKVWSTKAPLHSLRYQPTPIKDFMNFKTMTSNEILLNLDNHDSLADSELVGGLLELANRDAEQRFNWNEHAITASCLQDMKERQPQFAARHIAQAQLIMDRLQVTDAAMWQANSQHVLRLLHKYQARDMAQFLDVFDRDVLDDEGEAIGVQKTADDTFFERIVGLLPMFVKDMSNPAVVRCLEVLTSRNLGSQRLFDHYMLYMVEKHLLRYPVPLYSRLLRVMADRQFVEDYVFWDTYAFKYVYVDPRRPEGRIFTHEEAKQLWDSFVYLKLKCPSIDIKDVLVQLEKFIAAPKLEAKE